MFTQLSHCVCLGPVSLVHKDASHIASGPTLMTSSKLILVV